MTEDDKDALTFPIDAARKIKGGQKNVTARLMELFDKQNNMEVLYA